MFEHITRAQRRQLERENQKWPMSLQEIPRDQWPQTPTADTRLRVLRGRDFMVQVFEAEAPAIVRLSVNRTTLAGNRWDENITWDQLQWIKAQCGYPERDAVEVYPPTWDIVNVANMRHLWVLEGYLPFAWRNARLGISESTETPA